MYKVSDVIVENIYIFKIIQDLSPKIDVWIDSYRWEIV